MTSPRQRIASSLLVLVLTCQGDNWSRAEDWPAFGRDHTRNAVSPETSPPTECDVGKFDRTTGEWQSDRAHNVKWVARLGSNTCGDPVVAGGLVWIGTNNAGHRPADSNVDASSLLCFRESDGEMLFAFDSLRLAEGRAQDWPLASLGSSPLAEGDRIWFTTNRCETVCLDVGPLQRGEGDPVVVWKLDMRQELGVVPHPLPMGVGHTCSVGSYGDYIYVITGNGVDERHAAVPAPQAPSLVCLEKGTGAVVWTDNSPGANILSGQWASPLAIEVDGRPQVIAPQGDGWLRSFDALTGDLVWQFDMNAKETLWNLTGQSTRNTLLSTPVLYNERVFLASGSDWGDGEGRGRLCCIDPKGTGDISAELAVDAEGNVIPHRGEQAVDPERGERAIPNPNSGLVWEYTEHDLNGDGRIKFEERFHRTMSNVAIKDDLLMAVDKGGLVHCLDANTGQVYWTCDMRSSATSSPLIVADTVYATDEDGDVAVFGLSADPQSALSRDVRNRFAPLHKISVGTSVHCSPVFANGVLYVATRSWLFAIAATPDGAGAAPSPAAENEESEEPGLRAPRAAFSPTPHAVVDEMLKLAELKDSDVVCDLGCGDGRILIAAARQYRCRAVGFEIDAELVRLARAEAAAAGVDHLVTIEHQDLFDADLSRVDVVVLYLLPGQLEELLPQLRQLPAGTRIVAHHFPLPELPPDRQVTVESPEDEDPHELFLWRAPLMPP